MKRGKKYLKSEVLSPLCSFHSDKHQTHKTTTPPSMLPGWDSGIPDEYQSPPIENDEWLAFLNRYMQEILDGEIESLKQQNLVCDMVTMRLSDSKIYKAETFTGQHNCSTTS